MSIQFGIATMFLDGLELGILQGVTINIAYTTAQLFSGASIFPVDVRAHTGAITGTAEFADLTAAAFEKLLGAHRTGSSVALSNTSYPGTFQLVANLVTDNVDFKITFKKVRSNKLALAFARDKHLIPNFDFEIQADAQGNVATIDVGDVS